MWNWVVLGIGFAMYIEGVGYHVDSLSQHAVHNISKWLLITEIIYIWNLCWTKLSLLMMYYRIFHLPGFKKQVIAVGAFVVCWAITISFLFTFICKPVEKLWIPELEGKCLNEVGVWLANASSTIFSDIVILLLPIPQIWRLHLKKSEKIGLTVVFGLGFLYFPHAQPMSVDVILTILQCRFYILLSNMGSLQLRQKRYSLFASTTPSLV